MQKFRDRRRGFDVLHDFHGCTNFLPQGGFFFSFSRNYTRYFSPVVESENLLPPNSNWPILNF